MSDEIFFSLPSTLTLLANSPVPLPEGTIISENLYLSIGRGFFVYATTDGVVIVFGVRLSSREECFFDITVRSYIPLEISGKVDLNVIDNFSTLFLNQGISLSFGLNSFPLSTFHFNPFIFSLLSSNRNIPFALFLYRSINLIPLPVYLSIDSCKGRLEIFNPNRTIIDVSRLSILVPPIIGKVCQI